MPPNRGVSPCVLCDANTQSDSWRRGFPFAKLPDKTPTSRSMQHSYPKRGFSAFRSCLGAIAAVYKSFCQPRNSGPSKSNAFRDADRGQRAKNHPYPLQQRKVLQHLLYLRWSHPRCLVARLGLKFWGHPVFGHALDCAPLQQEGFRGGERADRQQTSRHESFLRLTTRTSPRFPSQST
jgi:hypothetical protein